MPPFYQIDADPPSALVRADFSVVICLLQDDHAWGAKVVRFNQAPSEPAQPPAWAARLYPSKIIPYDQNHFIALGRVAKTGWLAYRVERAGEGQVKITPTGHLPMVSQVLTLAGLLLLGVAPALLAPILWWCGWWSSRQASREHLAALCRYLEEKLIPVTGCLPFK